MKIPFDQHKEQTAKDCEQIAQSLNELAKAVREGNFLIFEQFWLKGGTEEGDAKIQAIREMIALRYLYRQENLA